MSKRNHKMEDKAIKHILLSLPKETINGDDNIHIKSDLLVPMSVSQVD